MPWILVQNFQINNQNKSKISQAHIYQIKLNSIRHKLNCSYSKSNLIYKLKIHNQNQTKFNIQTQNNIQNMSQLTHAKLNNSNRQNPYQLSINATNGPKIHIN